MHEENPGVAAAAGKVLIVPTAVNVAGMRDALRGWRGSPRRGREGRELGPPEEEGYLPRGLRRNRPRRERAPSARSISSSRSSPARRASEVGGGSTASSRRRRGGSLAGARRARDRGGVRPQGNPDRLPTIRAQAWLRYSLGRRDAARGGRYERVHGGFDVARANEDPNRLVPLDTVRAPRRRGPDRPAARLFYTTTGNGTPVATVDRFGREIAGELREAGVESRAAVGNLRDGHALRGSAGEGDRTEGIPTVFVTSLPTIATMIGVNRSFAARRSRIRSGSTRRSGAGSWSARSRCSRQRSSRQRSGRSSRA